MMRGSGSKDSPLERYISVLEILAPFSDGLTATELEAALDLPKTTINRLLRSLADSGLISTASVRNRTYRLGDRLLALLHASPDTSWVATLAERPLQVLADATGQSAYISKFNGTEIHSVTCVAPDTPVRTYVMPGMAMPLNAAASAKAILAFHPKELVAKILQKELHRYTEKTKTSLRDVERELTVVRKQGFATDLAEHVAGLGSIAFPILLANKEVAYAVGLTGPYGQVIERNFESNRDALARTAERLAKLLQLRADSPTAGVKGLPPSQH
jgi:DNA-binding IclR family transcriptional regulator